MNPVILTEVAENAEAVEETTQTFGEILNSNPGIVGFAVGCLCLVGIAVYVISTLSKKNSKKRR